MVHIEVLLQKMNNGGLLISLCCPSNCVKRKNNKLGQIAKCLNGVD